MNKEKLHFKGILYNENGFVDKIDTSAEQAMDILSKKYNIHIKKHEEFWK